jgi:phosphate-selective porin OprO/OprP
VPQPYVPLTYQEPWAGSHVLPPSDAYIASYGSSYGSYAGYESIPGDEQPSDAVKNLTEADIKSIIDKHLKDKEAEKESKLTAKEKKDRDLAMSAKWNDGFEVSTKNKHFRTHVGGRVQFDSAWFQTPQNVQNAIATPYGDGADFRRARLRVDGTMYEVHDFAAEFDFVNAIRVRNQPANSLGATGLIEEAVTAPTDLWWTIKELPIVGNMKIGNQKEAIGFEHIVSSRYLPFMERSFNQDAFYGGLYNGFQPGVSIYNTYDNENGVWNMGLFKPTDNVFASGNGDGDYAVTGRITRLLAYDDDGRRLLHVGLSGRQGTAVQKAGFPFRVQVFRARDAVRTGLSAGWPVPAGITVLGDDIQWANGELVGVLGSFTFQSEYLVSALQDARLATSADPTNLVYHGGYAQVMYFLTGEHDHYNRKTGVFERLRPNTNFFKPNKCDGGISGMGAWQIGVRYNYLDLNDNAINGGVLHNLTAGLNWFWNPNMKWQFNYSATERDVSAVAGSVAGTPINTGSGMIHGFGTRVAMDF